MNSLGISISHTLSIHTKQSPRYQVIVLIIMQLTWEYELEMGKTYAALKCVLQRYVMRVNSIFIRVY